MQTWLVTGGAGFIGANFCYEAARKTPHQLLVLDALTYAGDLHRLANLITEKRVQFISGNITDKALLKQIFTEHAIDKIIHFAAESHVDRSILEPEEFLATNIEGTYCLLEAAREHWQDNLDGKLFLHVSTDEVFGSLAPSALPFTELSPYAPTSPYSASKAASDHLVQAWHHTYGLPTIISNCSNNYGPWQYPEKFIPLLILNALEEKKLPIYGDGMQIRDWLHVNDHVAALLLLLEKGCLGERYVIGGNNERTNLQIVQLVCQGIDEITGRERTAERLIQHIKDRPGHDRRYAINSQKIASKLNWRPTHDFEQSIRELILWYRDHQDWTSKIRSENYQQYYAKQYSEELIV